MDSEAEVTAPEESVTESVIGDNSTEVGVPAITPVEASRVSPGGRDPNVTDHIYDHVPPRAFKFCEYGVPTEPNASDVVVTTRGSAAIVIVRLDSASLPAESKTMAPTDTEPLADGVPEMYPVAGLR